ncbi:hypothetical protein JS528_11095 [Bifidobacterium sp. MA2]|uniref:Uncharacterized protein n=1 Tax=Bifidobacterium santillanense TaxID=2809028 RepID=A0ABS5US85_9BIFI|nr:hypothetical protein [Bifidobacterium santillanense]MBT1173865.1 hypothetical protein [Bifidobacterium santillanense]
MTRLLSFDGAGVEFFPERGEKVPEGVEQAIHGLWQVGGVSMLGVHDGSAEEHGGLGISISNLIMRRGMRPARGES